MIASFLLEWPEKLVLPQRAQRLGRARAEFRLVLCRSPFKLPLSQARPDEVRLSVLVLLRAGGLGSDSVLERERPRELPNIERGMTTLRPSVVPSGPTGGTVQAGRL